ncbi:unnamed protein product [Cuscuta epithymum]|uniref:Uncharacterized protein n=1 Tax=Cuscuta epithymum TaxID=186058 RepID=A0AAV0DUE1_9ASTE|nr:unnamed protein product [Cuscuta epithymum]CAH9107107.1 unnamed protein product [Cuscuta epithymum]
MDADLKKAIGRRGLDGKGRGHLLLGKSSLIASCNGKQQRPHHTFTRIKPYKLNLQMRNRKVTGEETTSGKSNKGVAPTRATAGRSVHRKKEKRALGLRARAEQNPPG